MLTPIDSFRAYLATISKALINSIIVRGLLRHEFDQIVGRCGILEKVIHSALLVTAFGGTVVDFFSDEVNVLPGMISEVTQKGSNILTPAMPRNIS